MIHLSKNEFPLILREIPVVLYGGGAVGRLICDLLIQNDIRIMYIVDDSVSLCGSYIRQIKVISYNEFCEYIKEYEKVAVIMTTIYGKSVLNKMCLIHNIIVYELYDWFMKLNGDEKWLQEMFRDTINVQQMKIQIGLLRGKWADKESEYVLDAIMNYKKLYYTEGTDCASGRIVDYETNHVIDTVSIDEYFQNQKCNYIKMDIEGAEYEALIGGMQVIKRDRPILAISVYHFFGGFLAYS